MCVFTVQSFRLKITILLVAYSIRNNSQVFLKCHCTSLKKKKKIVNRVLNTISLKIKTKLNKKRSKIKCEGHSLNACNHKSAQLQPAWE